MAQAHHLGSRESATFGLLGHGVSGILPKRRHGALKSKTVTIPRTDADPQRLLVLPRGEKAIETKMKAPCRRFLQLQFSPTRRLDGEKSCGCPFDF